MNSKAFLLIARAKLLKVVLLLTVFIFSAEFSFGQSRTQDSILRERVYLITNSSFFIVGESLLFTARCNSTPDKLSEVSKILYVELIDENAEVVLTTKISLTNGLGFGDLFLPSKLISGNYTLIAYSQWMKNFESNKIFRKQLTVINPFRKPVGKSADHKTESISHKIVSDVAKGTGVSLSINQKKFKTRQQVNLTLEPNDTLSSTINISVRKIEPKIKELEALYFLNNPTTNNEHYSAEKLSSPKYFPEIRGKMFSGIVLKNALPAKGEKVYFSIPSKNYFFTITTTDSAGRYYLNTDKLKIDGEAILQIDSSVCVGCTIVPDRDGLMDYSFFKPSALEIDSSYRNIIENRSINAQIEAAYYESKKDSIILEINTPRFYGKADVTYRLDDYTRFPAMEDVLIEYIGEIVLRKKQSGYEVRVRDTRKGVVFENKPMLLIDGVPIFNTDHLIKYNPLRVDKIEIVSRRYFYGALETDGIISITTYDGKASGVASNRIKYEGVQPRKKYFSPNHNLSSINRIPDNRIQLYWNPLIKLTSKSLPLTFYTSDVKGIFEVEINGVQKSGEQVHIVEKFEVE